MSGTIALLDQNSPTILYKISQDGSKHKITIEVQLRRTIVADKKSLVS